MSAVKPAPEKGGRSEGTWGEALAAEYLRQRGWRVKKANNDVADGIRVTADLLRQRRIVLCNTCRDCLREMALYCWDEKAGKDAPKKEHDHAMDEMRYFAMDLVGERSGGFAAISVVRKA